MTVVLYSVCSLVILARLADEDQTDIILSLGHQMDSLSEKLPM